MIKQIQIPYKFEPRPYQVPLLKALDSGIKRAFCVWHRRAGKDKTYFNIVVKEALKRVGTYFYLFPTYAQGRKVLWDGMDNDGFKFIHHIPKQLIKSIHSQEMKVTLNNGSVIQIVGTDDPDRIRGTNAIGWVFSEYAWHNPIVWTAIATPVLRANSGWAIFNTTPFGKNHAYDLWSSIQDDDAWFKQLLTIEDTYNFDGNHIVTKEDIENDKKLGMSDEFIEQEYYCSFTANSQGFYYLKYITEAYKDGRITNVPYDSTIPVDTWWDIGVGDSTAIWFTQTVNKEIHIIDYYENNSQGIEHYVKYLQSQPYYYNSWNFPHDMANIEFGTGRSRIEVLENMMVGNIELNILQKLPLEDGINAARVIFPRCYFDKTKCEVGLHALQNYRREWDDKRQEFRNKPLHDWCSHAADAFRYFATGLTIPRVKSERDTRLKKYGRLKVKSWMVA